MNIKEEIEFLKNTMEEIKSLKYGTIDKELDELYWYCVDQLKNYSIGDIVFKNYIVNDELDNFIIETIRKKGLYHVQRTLKNLNLGAEWYKTSFNEVFNTNSIDVSKIKNEMIELIKDEIVFLSHQKGVI